MSEPTVDCDPFEVVAESFRARFRSDQRPSVEEFAARYPELAQQIRDLLPALVMVEQDLGFDPDAGPDGEPPRPDPVPQPSGESAARLAAVLLAAGLWRYGSGTFTARNRQTGRLSPKRRILGLRERSH